MKGIGPADVTGRAPVIRRRRGGVKCPQQTHQRVLAKRPVRDLKNTVENAETHASDTNEEFK
jgi:hypothetical protein